MGDNGKRAAVISQKRDEIATIKPGIGPDSDITGKRRKQGKDGLDDLVNAFGCVDIARTKQTAETITAMGFGYYQGVIRAFAAMSEIETLEGTLLMSVEGFYGGIAIQPKTPRRTRQIEEVLPEIVMDGTQRFDDGGSRTQQKPA